MTIDTLWYTRCPVPTAFGLAVQLGWVDAEFAADGIALRSLASSTDRSVRQAHFQQSQPNAFRHGGNTPPLVALSQGGDLRIIGISWHDAYKPILALPGSGIASIADLKGRRISLPRRRNDPIDFWRGAVLRGFSVALESAGLSLGDVELVDVATDRAFVDDAAEAPRQAGSLWDARYMLGHQREEAFALIRGEVDVIYSQGAMAVILEAFLGAVTVLDNGSLPERRQQVNNDGPLILTVSGGLLRERPDLVHRLLAQVLSAGDWAIRHERETKRIIAAEVGIAEELVDRAFSPKLHQQLAVDLSPGQRVALRSQHDHLLANGFLAGPLDLDEVIDAAPLAAARALLAEPFAVARAR